MSGGLLFCGAWDEGPGYPRARSLRQGFAAAGVPVRDCRVSGLGRDKQRLLRAPWRWPRLWLEQRRARQELLGMLRRALAADRPDAVLVPYPGHAIVGAVREAVDVPVVLDLFLSAYDTIVEDRRLVLPGSLGAAWLQRLDRAACSAADRVLLDTPENALYASSLTGLPAERFAWLPVHDPDAPQHPVPHGARGDGPLRLLFFGTGVPLHGLRTLLHAVAQVPDVALTLVGGTAADRALARGLLGHTVTLEPEFVDRERLAALLADSQLVAGVFGDGGKAQRVVPFKLVHALAAGRPVVTADTPAVRRWLDGSGAVVLTPAGDVQALAATLRELAASPEALRAAATAARPAYDRHFGTGALATRCSRLWRELGGVAAREVA
ncbi:MAG: glycosyltransferase [Planctomycetes bacterium]|nr:glycosyltransferase [Planctomycetota bacterium]